MKWSEIELLKVKELINEGMKYTEIANIVNRTAKAISIKINKLGYLSTPKPIIRKICIECNNEINNHGVKFCSQSCSATYNNKLRIKKPSRLRHQITCVNCGKNGKSVGRVFCSKSCYVESNKKKVINKIESGDTTLYFTAYKKYLIEKHGCKCMECGWDKTNITSGNVPIELEHIDGDSTNNKLENLKLLCPNCHSLTPTYKALNKGNGRHSRMIRYNEGKSF